MYNFERTYSAKENKIDFKILECSMLGKQKNSVLFTNNIDIKKIIL